jgi:hypothetical protein
VGPRRGEEKILDLPGLELGPLDHPVRSQSLYQLSDPGSTIYAAGSLIF